MVQLGHLAEVAEVAGHFQREAVVGQEPHSMEAVVEVVHHLRATAVAGVHHLMVVAG